MTSFNIGDLVVDNGGFPGNNSGLVGKVLQPYGKYLLIGFEETGEWAYLPEELSLVKNTKPTVTFEGKEHPVTTITRPKSVDLDETEFAFDTPYRRIRKDTYGHYVRSHGQRVAVTLKGVV